MEDTIKLYTDEQLKTLEEVQFQNKFISDHKDVFFSVCNKILDFLYTEEEVDSKRDKPMYEDVSVIKDSSKDFEMIRKKVKNEAPLSQGEIASLLVASQYACTDMARLAIQFSAASRELEEYIKTLTFQDK